MFYEETVIQTLQDWQILLRKYAEMGRIQIKTIYHISVHAKYIITFIPKFEKNIMFTKDLKKSDIPVEVCLGIVWSWFL